MAQLVQLSLYWFGINAIWGGLNIVLQERVPPLAPAGEAGRAARDHRHLRRDRWRSPSSRPSGSISDYTISRWGRRKPYIAIGSVLDVVFLIGIATSQTYLSIFAFVVLLQFSSNFAQGPFQGYIPDLVPGPQVGLASALVGVMSILGVVGGTLVISIGYVLHEFTMPIDRPRLRRARDGHRHDPVGPRGPRPEGSRGSVLARRREARRGGRTCSRSTASSGSSGRACSSWPAIAVLPKLAVLYMTRSLGLDDAARRGSGCPATLIMVARRHRSSARSRRPGSRTGSGASR